MKLSELKNQLSNLDEINIILPNGQAVPSHFHITEVGLTTKHFIDCGGDVHTNTYANIQIWVADDLHHRLQPSKFLHIIDLSEKVLQGNDYELEVEYQTDTIGIYGLEVQGSDFKLVPKFTDCLAKVKCNLPQPKQKLQLIDLTANNESCCTPGGGCC